MTDGSDDLAAVIERVVPAKTARPRAHRAMVRRTGAFNALARAPAARIVHIVAGAGWGKTELLGRLAAEAPGQVAWLTVDADDDDPERFWTHLVHAVALAAGTTRRAGATPPAGPAAVEALVERLAAVGDILVVIDDLHTVSDRSVLADLRALVDRAPQNVCFAIAARRDRMAGLAKKEAAGAAVRLGEADLRLSAPEIYELLDDHSAVSVSLAVEIVSVTGGWPVAVQLALQAMRHTADPQAALHAALDRPGPLHRYLLDEMLEHEHADVRRFLAEISVLGRITPGAAAAVTGRDDAPQLLSGLAVSHLFIRELATAEPEYRLHEVVRGLLRRWLTASGADVAALNERAARHWEREGEELEAIDHYIEASLLAEAMRLARPNLQRCFEEGRLSALARWWQHLPQTGPGGSGLEAATLWMLALTGQDHRLRRRLLAIDRARARGEADLPPVGDVDTVRAMQAYRLGNVELAASAAERASAAYREQPGPELSMFVAEFYRARAALLRRDLDVVERVLDDRMRRLSGPRPAWYSYVSTRAKLALAQGDHEQALALARSVADVEEHIAQHWAVIIDLRLTQGSALSALSALGQRAAARELLLRALELAAARQHHLHIVQCDVELALLEHAEGNSEPAPALIDHARQVVGLWQMSPAIVGLVDAAAARAGLTPAVVGDELITEREMEVLALLPTRLPNAAIAEQLYVSVNTIKFHMKSIYRKLGVGNRYEAVERAVALGLVD